MIFRTQLLLPPHNHQIDQNNSTFCIGSCFAENISRKMSEVCLNVTVNPLGVMYNPISICQTLDRISKKKYFQEEELMYNKNSQLYYSFDSHTLLNNETIEDTLNLLNKKIDSAHKSFTESDFLIITFGTSWLYKLTENGKVVANCQKQPSSLFTRESLSVPESVNALKTLFLKDQFKHKQIILTVSPIRHIKDGLQQNTLSKSTLICAVHELCSLFENVTYFPSYEIMLDDLRDYRFYTSDMIHPSEVAIDYIWESFKTRFIPETATIFFDEIISIRKSLEHRPFNKQSDSHLKFISKLDNRIKALNKKIGKKCF